MTVNQNTRKVMDRPCSFPSFRLDEREPKRLIALGLGCQDIRFSPRALRAPAEKAFQKLKRPSMIQATLSCRPIAGADCAFFETKLL